MTSTPEGAPREPLAQSPAPTTSRIPYQMMARYREQAAQARAAKLARTRERTAKRQKALRERRKAAKANPAT